MSRSIYFHMNKNPVPTKKASKMSSDNDTINPPEPPPAPPDLLTAVKLVFAHRIAAAHRTRMEEEAREEAEYCRLQEEVDAVVPVKKLRQAADEHEEEEKPEGPFIHRRQKPNPRLMLTWAQIDRHMDEEVEKFTTLGLGLKRVQGESTKHYNDRMSSLELRLDQWISIEYCRQVGGPLRYMDGLPVSLIHVHRHVRPPSPPKQTRRKPCLQCKARGLRCSRTMDVAYGPASKGDAAKMPCSRCRRNGDECLTMWNWEVDDGKDHEIWRYAEGPRQGQAELAKALIEEINSRNHGFKALPAWHENDRPENVGDGEYEPKRWWNMLKDGLTEW